MVDGRAVVGIVPVSGSLDLKALAAAAGGRRAEMADGATAQRLTGYVLGGISPIGQKRVLPTFVDDTAELLDTVYVSGGRRGFDIGLAPADLLSITGGAYAPIGRPDR
jgi:Cys-tRNA(Pro)/Cys-tRNA(Cys) deacylase